MSISESNPAAASLPNGDCGRPRAPPGGNRVTVVLGAQWGDEGKGKVVDLLAQDADIVCRCQVRGAGPWRGTPGRGRCHLELRPLARELRGKPLPWSLGWCSG